jgi:LEA14-like dessication related protein
MVFNGIDADAPSPLNLSFSMKIENYLSAHRLVKIESWRVEVNGKKADSGFSLESPATGFFPLPDAEGRGETAHSLLGSAVSEMIPIGLEMDIAALAEQGLAPEDNYRVNLILELGFYGADEDSRGLVPSAKALVYGLAAFPWVQAPEFSITAIAILKAELINTRFRVNMRIDNPNAFPVTLSAFSYELYGNGRLWADGTERNVFSVPAKSSINATLFLLMNFINMERTLLDQIIRLSDVNYAFNGDVQVATGLDYLPKFTSAFNLSGYSEVLEN